jgi:hypothetical protein
MLTTKMKLVEKIDPKKGLYIARNLGRFPSLPELYHSKNNKKPSMQQQASVLTKYISRANRDGEIEVTYNRTGFKQQGRFHAQGLAVQTVQRAVRQTLIKDHVDDVDMKNCHPTGLVHLCKTKYKLPCPETEKYVSDRPAYFQLYASHFGNPPTRDACKQFFLGMMNGKTIFDIDTFDPKILALYREWMGIRNAIVQAEVERTAWVKEQQRQKGQEEKNIPGKVLNSVLTEHESAVFITAKAAAEEKGITVHSACHDGFTSWPKGAMNHDILRHIEAKVREEHNGLESEWAVKPMDEALDLGPEYDAWLTESESSDVPTSGEYEELKEWFEKNHLKCRAQFYTIHPDGMTETQSKADFVTTYEHLPNKFIRRWLQDPDMRLYDKVQWLPPPLVCPAGTYNLWTGLSVEKMSVEPGTVDLSDLFYEHVRMLCNYEEEQFKYAIKLIADLVQNPGKKNGICWLLKSMAGLGKDFLSEIMALLIGAFQYGNTQYAKRDILDTFNGYTDQKVLIVLNEMKGEIGFKYSERLKDLITGTNAKIRKMRKDVEDKPSSVTWWMFTNNEFPVKVSKDDRRFFLTVCHQDPPSKEYFIKLGQLKDPSQIRLLYDRLCREDVSVVDWIRDRPKNEDYKVLQQVTSVDLQNQFVLSCLKERYHANRKGEWNVSASDLYDKFTERYPQRADGRGTTGNEVVKFGNKLMNIFNFKQENKKNVWRGDGADKTRAKKGMVYNFYDLEKCIKAYMKKGFLEEDWFDLPSQYEVGMQFQRENTERRKRAREEENEEKKEEEARPGKQQRV